MLALDVLGGGWTTPLRSLESFQIAPPLYLLTLKAGTALFGHGELVLRLPAFAAGVLTLFFLFRVAQELAGRENAVATALLAGCSIVLLRYSAEVKPYAWDALFGAAIPYVLLQVERGVRAPRVLVSLWAAAMVVGSVAAPILVGGLVLALAASREARRRLGWPALIAFALVGAVGYLALYCGVYWDYLHSGPMGEFWKEAYLTLWEPDLFSRTRRVLRVFASLLPSLAPLAGEWRSLLLLAAGFLLFRGRRGLQLAIVAPSVLALACSALGVYPIAPRLVLFSLTPLLVCLAQVFTALAGTSESERRRAVAVLLVLGVAAAPSVTMLPLLTSLLRVFLAALAAVLLSPRLPATVRLAVPAALALVTALPGAIRLLQNPVVEDGRSTIARVIEAGSPTVYVPAASTPAWLYYTSRWDGSDEERLRWYLAQAKIDGAANPFTEQSNGAPPATERVWRHQDRMEIRGTAPGVVYRYPHGFVTGPRAGWAESEAAQIGALAGGALVIVETHPLPGANDALVAALRSAGWQRDSSFSERTASATYLHRSR
jgi:MFS family permease